MADAIRVGIIGGGWPGKAHARGYLASGGFRLMAVADLIQYTQDFGAFLQSANPNLPKSVVADLVNHHVVTLKDVIDAQAAKDEPRAYAAVRTAAGHMQQIADPLAEAIVQQCPDKFGS